MHIIDLAVTPLYLFIVYIVAYTIQGKISDPFSKRIFIPALSIKIFSGIALGLIYQFYYQGGDTLFYFKQSGIIREAFLNDPLVGLKLLLSNGQYEAESFTYASQLRWYRFPTEFFIVKVSALLGLLCLNAYSSISLFFTIFSFSGLWLLYRTLVEIKPQAKKGLAVSVFFIPSLFFWGSGLLKDSLMMGCLGYVFYAFHSIFIIRKTTLVTIILLVIGLYILSVIRIYILLGFIPPALLWIFIVNNKRIGNVVLRWLIAPIIFSVALGTSFVLTKNLTEGNSKYDLSQIPERTRINAQYLYRISLQQQGSAYYLGDLDGTYASMIRAAPQAILVTLFRPWLWEVNNPLMLISAVESLVYILFTLYVLVLLRPHRFFLKILNDPLLTFCLLFTILMAVAVGLNSFNFGTLVRYKIPVLPFYTGMLFILYSEIRRKHLFNNS